MRISVFGAGYVGLVTGACFAEMGNRVVCADIDESRIEGLKQSQCPIHEPGLEELLQKNTSSDRLAFTTDLDDAIRASDMLFIGVGTPTRDDGSTDLDAVEALCERIARVAESTKTVVIKSTVPVGTVRRLREQVVTSLRRRGVGFEIEVVGNPEFLRQGNAVSDCLRPSRVVIGSVGAPPRHLLDLYAPFFPKGEPEIHCMDPESAEMTKYAANALLAVKLSFMNELARFCETTGADIEQVRRGIGSDPRLGPHFLYAGVGFGGSCLPKDIRSLATQAQGHGHSLSIIQAAESVNLDQRKMFVEKVAAHFEGQLEGKTLAVWGLTFKAGTGDLREAPSKDVIPALMARGARVQAYDPVWSKSSQTGLFGDGFLGGPDQYRVLEGVDALVILTEWNSFRQPDFALMKARMKAPVIFDGRNLYDPLVASQYGFKYVSIGRAPTS